VAGVLASALAVAGCTLPVVKIPIGAAALAYGDFKYLQAVVTLRVTDLCTAKKLSDVDCVWLKAQGEKAELLDKDLRKAILDAKGEVDQEKVMQYLQILAGIAVKIGGL
jgi:hypothetical protein